jgi:hypothetical protein
VVGQLPRPNERSYYSTLPYMGMIRRQRKKKATRVVGWINSSRSWVVGSQLSQVRQADSVLHPIVCWGPGLILSRWNGTSPCPTFSPAIIWCHWSGFPAQPFPFDIIIILHLLFYLVIKYCVPPDDHQLTM